MSSGFLATRLRYCQILKVSVEATPDAIRKAYLALSKTYHPDKSKDDTAEMFRVIKKAYDWLSENPYAPDPMRDSTNDGSNSDRAKNHRKKDESAGSQRENERPKERPKSDQKQNAEKEETGGGPKASEKERKTGEGHSQKETVHYVDCSLEELYSGAMRKFKVNGVLRTIVVKEGFKGGTKIKYEDGITFIIREKPHPRFTRIDDDLHYTPVVSVSVFDVLKCADISIDGLQQKHTFSLRAACLKNGFRGVIKAAGMTIRKPMPGQINRGDVVIKLKVDYSLHYIPPLYLPSHPYKEDVMCTLEDLFLGTMKSVSFNQRYTDRIGNSMSKIMTKEIEIKKGWKEGTKITFYGQGGILYGFKPVDVTFVIKQADHLQFRREGDDLYLNEDYARTLETDQSVRLLGGRFIKLDGSTKTYAGFGMPLKSDPSRFGNFIVPQILLKRSNHHDHDYYYDYDDQRYGNSNKSDRRRYTSSEWESDSETDPTDSWVGQNPCFNCGGHGHFARECTRPRLARSDHTCENCGELGHFPRHCERKRTVRPDAICRRCQRSGHFLEDCTNREVPTATTECARCRGRGHLPDDCRKPQKARPDYDCKFCGGQGHFPRDCPNFAPRPCPGKLCNRCQKSGHHPADCTNRAVAGPNSKCFRCQKLGHLSKDCTNMKVATPKDQCYNCMEYGHLQRDCRNLRKANQFTECTNCGGKGHYARECDDA